MSNALWFLAGVNLGLATSNAIDRRWDLVWPSMVVAALSIIVA